MICFKHTKNDDGEYGKYFNHTKNDGEYLFLNDDAWHICHVPSSLCVCLPVGVSAVRGVAPWTGGNLVRTKPSVVRHDSGSVAASKLAALQEEYEEKFENQ